jgi:hypothetical protein
MVGEEAGKSHQQGRGEDEGHWGLVWLDQKRRPGEPRNPISAGRKGGKAMNMGTLPELPEASKP